MKILNKITLLGVSILLMTSCSSDGGGSGDGDSGQFSYEDIGPNLGEDWFISDARRTDTGLWALYYNQNSPADKLARYDFSSKQWQFWDYANGIEDFDVWLEGEDNGNGAVVIENTTTPYSPIIHSLSSAINWDIENIDQPEIAIALGWGSGSAAFNNWVGGTHYTNRAVYQETGTCCPLQWNKMDNLLPSYINNMWASPRSDAYVLVTTADKTFIIYSDGGSEIQFSNENAAIQSIAWDVQTKIPYALIDGIVYKIVPNPNNDSASTEIVADLTEFNQGITFGISGMDIRNGHAFVSYGAVVDLSNGNVSSSWIGEINQTSIDDNLMVNSISTSSYLFVNPNNQNDVFVNVNIVDPNTFESTETWIKVNNAL
jgi:hypothetical protein